MKVERIHIILFLLLLLFATACTNHSTQKANKPNIVLILTDDQGWGDVGFHGNDVLETPFIDSLAQQSVVLDRFYVSPVCAPTRASLLTGKYHLSTGTSWVTHRKEVMREEEITLAEILKDAGYRTGCFGKWHNGAQYPHNANGQGFETFFGFSAGHLNNYFDAKLEYNAKEVKSLGYIADVLTDSVLSFIDRNSNAPFFAYVAYNTPHTPYQVADTYFNYYKAKGLDDKLACIYGMCQNIDDNVSRIAKKLNEKNIDKNTVFIFLSDNGPNSDRFNGSFKGRKAKVDEGGVRVPFVLYYPNGEYKVGTISEMTAHIDLMPTLLEICKVEMPRELKLDGISLLNLLTGESETLPDRVFFTHQVRRELDEVPGAVRTSDYLLTLKPEDTALYNITTDPFQENNLIKEEPVKADSLAFAYHKWFKGVAAEGLESQSIHVGYENSPITKLPAHEAKLSGQVLFQGIDGWANDWVKGAGQMSWEIKVVQDSDFNISLEYSLDGKSTGSSIELIAQDEKKTWKLEEIAYAGFVKNNDRVKRGEVAERAWHYLDLGTYHFKKGKSSVSLVLKPINSLHGLEVKSLIIKKNN